MKKIIVALLLLLSLGTYAQDQVFFKGDQRLTLGAGLHSNIATAVTLDIGIIDGIADLGVIGVGPYLSMGIKNNDFKSSMGARVTFHYPLIDKMDTYIGSNFGISYVIVQLEDHDNVTAMEPGLVLGASYPLNSKVRLFAEAGTGVAYLLGGLAFNLN